MSSSQQNPTAAASVCFNFLHSTLCAAIYLMYMQLLRLATKSKWLPCCWCLRVSLITSHIHTEMVPRTQLPSSFSGCPLVFSELLAVQTAAPDACCKFSMPRAVEL